MPQIINYSSPSPHIAMPLSASIMKSSRWPTKYRMQFSVDSLLPESWIRYETPGRSPRPFPCVQNNLYQTCLGHTSTYLPYSESVSRERNVCHCVQMSWIPGTLSPSLGKYSLKTTFLRAFSSIFGRRPQVVLKVSDLLGVSSPAGLLCGRRPLLGNSQTANREAPSQGTLTKRFKRQLNSFKRIHDYFKVVCLRWMYLKVHHFIFIYIYQSCSVTPQSGVQGKRSLFIPQKALLFLQGPCLTG